MNKVDVKGVLNRHFKMKDFGRVRHFLGMVVEQDIEKGEIVLN